MSTRSAAHRRITAAHEDLDTQLLAGALTELGIGSSTVPWTLVTDRTDADLAVIRTTWDYTFRREEFLGFLESLPMPVVNPSAVARWNSHKGYLVELGAAGVPVVPVTMVAQGGRAPDAGGRRGPDHRQAGDLGRRPRGRAVRMPTIPPRWNIWPR